MATLTIQDGLRTCISVCAGVCVSVRNHTKRIAMSGCVERIVKG